MKVLHCVLASLVFALCAPVLAGEEPLVVRDAWIPESPPTAEVLAAYLTLQNNTGGARVLLRVDSACCERVQMHRTLVEEGVARMIEQKEVVIGAEETVRFEPGGLHLMLMGVKEPPRAGDSVELRLHFADGTRVPVTAEVRKRHGGMEHHHH